MRRHATEALIPPATLRVRDGLLSALLALAAVPAAALGLGELRVQSFIGEPLVATVNLLTSEEEEVAAECFASAPISEPGVPVLTGARMTLERSGARSTLRIQTFAPISEPTLRLRLLTTCSSAGGLSRDYLLTLDPRPVERRPVASVTAPTAPARAPSVPISGRPDTTPAAEQAKSTPPLIPGFRPRPGDTLQSISSAIFPRDESARAAYLRALRARNAAAVANLGDSEPLPTDVLLILPDLKALSRTMPPTAGSAPDGQARQPKARPAERAQAIAPAAPPATREPGKATQLEAAAKPAPASGSSAPMRPAAPALPAATPTAERGSDGGFRLRLSAGELDVSRSRGVDERKRAEIRERRLLLEQDDQTAAMLGLRENLRQLENRFAALQRQVTSPTKSGSAEPSKTQASPRPPTPTPAPEPPVPVPASDSSPAPSGPTSAPAKDPDQGTPDTVQAPAPSPASAARPAPKRAAAEPAVDWPWLIVGITLALAAGGMALWKRHSERAETSAIASAPATPSAPAAKTRLPAPSGKSVTTPEPKAPYGRRPEHVEARTEPRLEPRRPAAPDKARAPLPPAATARASEESIDAQHMRTRYRQVRFPEIVSGSIVIADAPSVVRGARTLYEDGALPRALELLELAIADNPQARQPWLALLEIHRQEGLAADFGALAARFQWQHGDAPEWPKVQSIGRDFDPDNPLFASDKPAAFDPLTDNWLEVPSDFSPGGLAAELHAAAVANARGRRAA